MSTATSAVKEAAVADSTDNAVIAGGSEAVESAADAVGEHIEHQTGVLRSIRDIVKDLSKPVAKRHLRTRKQGGRDITYIAWHDAIKYLDHYAPGWNYEVRSMTSIGGKLIMTVRVTIPAAEGLIFREATGQEEENTDSYGDSSSNAESMAIRRACAKFGLGLSLYDGQNK